MYKRLKKSGSIVLLMLMSTIILCGCIGKLTPKKIVLQMAESKYLLG